MEEKKEKKIDSKEIFEQTSTITIVHDGQEYQLRITKANKLPIPIAKAAKSANPKANNT